jgi:pimeloyl-ACP methyl ester carboxylesterase
MIMLKQFNIAGREIGCWINTNGFGEYQKSLIFIHGSGSDHSGWVQQYSHLHKHYNIVAVDLPGHGASSGDGENTVENYCLWVKKILDNLKPKKPILIGHSLGAAISLRFALDHSQDIAGIVPVGGGTKMPVNPDLLAGLKTSPALAIELISKFSLAKENRPKLFEPLKNSLAKANLDVLYGDLSACAKLDLREDINKINLPTLVICGEQDKMTPADLSRQIASAITGAQLRLIAGAGHMVMLEKPEDFNAAISKFASSLT